MSFTKELKNKKINRKNTWDKELSEIESKNIKLKYTKFKNEIRDKKTGHLKSCKYLEERGIYNFRCVGLKGVKCNNFASKQSCFPSNEHYCGSSKNGHFKQVCEITNWDPDLSICANYKCDEKGFNLAQREKISHRNITTILGLPSENKYLHVSLRRRKHADHIDKLIEKRAEEVLKNKFILTSVNHDACN